MKIGVVVKRQSEPSRRVAKELLAYGHEVLGLEMFVEPEVSRDVGWPTIFSLEADRMDFLIVVGGDGTLLRAVHRMKFIDTPIIGIKTGRRGFLLEVKPQEALARLRDLVEGRYEVREQMRLEALVNGGEKAFYALNEVVVAGVRSVKSSVVTLRVGVDGDTLYSFDGDGVIVSTPLGSTAYTFSAGGPVIDADLEAIAITPLAPIQPNAKPVVLSSSRVVDIENLSEAEVGLCIVDGVTVAEVQPGGRIVVRKASTGVRFVRFRRFETYKRVQTCEF